MSLSSSAFSVSSSPARPSSLSAPSSSWWSPFPVGGRLLRKYPGAANGSRPGTQLPHAAAQVSAISLLLLSCNKKIIKMTSLVGPYWRIIQIEMTKNAPILVQLSLFLPIENCRWENVSSSSAHSGEFDNLAALKELYIYVNKYYFNTMKMMLIMGMVMKTLMLMRMIMAALVTMWMFRYYGDIVETLDESPTARKLGLGHKLKSLAMSVYPQPPSSCWASPPWQMAPVFIAYSSPQNV